MAVRHHPILGVEQMPKVLADQDGFCQPTVQGMHSTGESQTNDLAVGRAHPHEVSAAALRDTGPGRCPATRLCSSSGAEMSTQPSLPALATRVSPPGAGDTGDRVDRRAAERPDCRMRAHTGREPGCAQSASVGPTVARRTRGVLEAPQRSLSAAVSTPRAGDERKMPSAPGVLGRLPYLKRATHRAATKPALSSSKRTPFRQSTWSPTCPSRCGG
jgi:hypothetical protein